MEEPDLDIGPGGIEGLERLKIPQSSFTFSRRARPPPIHLEMGSEEKREPLNPKLLRRESKGGLRTMFTRNKTEKFIASPLEEEPVPRSAVSDFNLKGVRNGIMERTLSVKRATTAVQTPTTPAASTPKTSRMTFRSKSVKTPKPVGKSSPPKATKPSPNRPTRTSTAWDPPPLFQAYPQAIKHAQLMAPGLSADSILRISNHKRNSSLIDHTSSQMGDGEPTAAAKKQEKAKNKHRRQISGSITKTDWIPKIFVLVTSGYLLQYSGEGSFDRLPEKMMQLGKDSVAFASDVIPGRHWVLQISQSLDADGTPTADSRSLLSRLTFRSADYRRTATSLLLVLDSAEEMDSWLALVRREIEGLGGKKHVSETGKPKADDNVMQLKAQPSHRYLLQRDPDQVSVPSPTNSMFAPLPWDRANSLQANVINDSSSLIWTRPPPRPSTSHMSTADSLVSQDGRFLENLRDSSHRLSHTSSGQPTFVTSRGSSPERSTKRDSVLTTLDDITPKMSLDETRVRPNALAISERRRSMQTISIPVLESQNALKTHRHSTYDRAATPNFSLPNTSSRRYSSIKTTTSASTATQTKASMKGSRKGPPSGLSVSVVKESLDTDGSVPVFTPTGTSFKLVQQIRASVVDIPPRSPLAAHPPSPVNLPLRRSSLMPGVPALGDSRPTPEVLLTIHASKSEDHLANFVFPPPLKSPIALERTFETQENNAEPAEQLPERVSPLPNIANTKTKLRRPASMQVRTNSSTTSTPITPKPAKGTSTASTPTHRLSTLTPMNGYTKQPVPKPKAHPTVQKLRIESPPKAVANRRSMPLLMHGGPPPAPAPTCALPPLPPGKARNAGSGGKPRSTWV